MTDQDTDGLPQSMSFVDYFKQARNKVREKHASQTGVVSFTNAVLRPPAASQPMPPVRENVADVAAPSSSINALSEHHDWPIPADDGDNLLLPVLGPAEYIVLLPIVSMVRELYEATIKRRRRDIQAFLGDENVDPAVTGRMNAMVDELKLLTDHQDLIADLSSIPGSVSDEHQAKWAVTCSSKCLFLQHFLRSMAPYEKHIVIVARPGRMLDILESILITDGLIYDRPDRLTKGIPGDEELLKVTLLPTGADGSKYVVNRADAVIAFDETFPSSEHYLHNLRIHPYEPNKLSPLISLVVANSAEHMSLCLPRSLELVDRHFLVVHFVLRTREEVGKLDQELPSPEEAASAISQYLGKNIDEDALLPLPANCDITGLQVPAGFDEQVRKPSALTSLSQEDQWSQEMAQQGAMKRSLGSEGPREVDAESTKRMRMASTLGEISSSGDVSRVSDSIGYSSIAKSYSTGEATDEAIAKMKAREEEQSQQISTLSVKVTTLDEQLRGKEKTEVELRNLIEGLEKRLVDHQSTLEKFRRKFVQAIHERGKFQTELADLGKVKAQMTTTIDGLGADIEKLEAEKTRLQNELTIARTMPAESTAPEKPEFAKAKAEVDDLKARNDGLLKCIANMQRDFEFARDSYQKASSAAAELANEVAQLKAENVVLQRKASENSVRIHEIQRSNQNEELAQEIDELKAVIKDREWELQKKHEELKIKTNGRRETRGTSVPRSPRMGVRAMVGGAGSRGASPVPGEQRDGFRDPPLFPPSSLGNARWGHLIGE